MLIGDCSRGDRMYMTEYVSYNLRETRTPNWNRIESNQELDHTGPLANKEASLLQHL